MYLRVQEKPLQFFVGGCFLPFFISEPSAIFNEDRDVYLYANRVFAPAVFSIGRG